MKAFEYAEPRTEADVLELLSSEPGKTEILAGGTDLVGLMKKMTLTPDRVVNIMEVEAYKQIGPQEDGQMIIGAAVTLDELLAHPYMDQYPAILQAICGINSMQFQSQGTLGGEICQRPQCWFFRDGRGLLSAEVAGGDNRFHAILGNSGPAKFVSGSRIGPALIALDAKLRIAGPQEGQETLMPVADFFRTPRHATQRETLLQPGQVVSHIILPPAGNSTSATYEVRHGVGPDYPLAAASVSLRFTGSKVQEAKVVLGHVAPTPWVSEEAARVLVGLEVDELAAEAAGVAAVAGATPLSSNEYKVQLAKVAVKRAILAAAGLETGGF